MFHQPTTIETLKKIGGNPKKIPSCGEGGNFFFSNFSVVTQTSNAMAIRNTYTKFHWPTVTGTLEENGKNVSGGAEWVLDPKYRIFKVPPCFNQVEFRHAVFMRVLRQGPKKAIETLRERNPHRKSKTNVVEYQHGCCGIYSTTRFAVAWFLGEAALAAAGAGIIIDK